MNLKQIKNGALALLAAASLAGGLAHATPVTVVNPSFEDDVQAYDTESYGSMTGWTGVGSDDGVRYPGTPDDFISSPLPPPGDSNQCGFANAGSLYYQDVGALQPLITYTLTVAVGARSSVSYGEGAGVLQLLNGTNNNGAILAQTAIDNTGLGGIFTNFTVTFTTSSSVNGDLTIVLSTTTAVQICYDNVRLDAEAAALAPSAAAPVISPTSAYAGDLVTLTEAATGPGPLYYEWETDNGSAGATFTPLTGFTNSSTYVIDTTGFTNSSYEFRVVVTNSGGSSTSAASTLTMVTGVPVVLQNPTPQTEYFMVGETAAMTAVFTGSRPLTYQWQVDGGDGPVNVTNGTFNSATLILTNLQTSDEGFYTCVASNSYGSTPTPSTTMLTVSAQPDPDSFGNIILEDNEANPTSYQPTYMLASSNLIGGLMPTASAGSFQQEGSAGIPVLTDGQYPPTGQNYQIMATVGNNGGTSLTYTLDTSKAPKGYNLSSIVAYGGWLNGGRDEVGANVSYSTVSDPGTFVQFGTYDYLPPYGNNPANRVTLLPSTGWLATNVAAVTFDFTIGGQGVENGYEGLAELQVLGQAVSVPGITIQLSGSNLVLTWSQGTLVQSTTVNGPWTTVSATSPYTVAPTGTSRFFKLLL